MWDTGCRSVTLDTDPDPLKTLIPTCCLCANCMTVSITSEPADISSITGFMAESQYSLVITMGGLGLFLDPGGLPLGFLDISGIDPNSVSQAVVLVPLVFLGLDDDDEPCPAAVAGRMAATVRGLCSEDSSSEVWNRSLPWGREKPPP